MKVTDRLKGTQTRLAEKLKRYRAARSAKKQRGVTLLEIIIVLGIIGTIAAGVVILAQRAFDNKAMSDLVSNLNAVRVAAKDAYGQTGIYPAGGTAAATVDLNETNLQTNGRNSPIGRLILLGKLSTQEARNPISGNYMYFAAANLGSTPGAANKGFVVQVNGLNRTQCRNLLTQVGNQWDYVEVAAGGMQAGNYIVDVKDLTVATAGVTGRTGSSEAGAVMSPQGVYRSLNSSTPSGNFAITADAVIGACGDGSNNGIILGSR